MVKFKRFALTFMTVLLAVVLVMPSSVFAAKETKAKADDPIREVHNVTIGNTLYCFFVTHNVVMTPKEVSEMSDEELSAAILEEAGFFMKKANCKKKGHDTITVKNWTKKGSVFLSTSDLESIREAEPVDGQPVKLYMDVRLTTEPYDPYVSEDDGKTPEDAEEGGAAADEEVADDQEEQKEQENQNLPDIYSTYKKVSPRLLFVVVATETDAASGEDICKEDPVKPTKDDHKKPVRPTPSAPSIPSAEPEEILPELRTIEMKDRSGKPVEDTLKDGDPVTLEWKEPDSIANNANRHAIIDRIPGGYYSIAGAILALALIIFLVARRKRNEDN